MKNLLLITLFFMSFKIFGACDAPTLQANPGINTLVTEGCDINDPVQRELIINQEAQAGEDISSAAVNLKYAALNKEVEIASGVTP